MVLNADVYNEKSVMGLDCFDIIPLVLHVCVFVRSLSVRSFVCLFAFCFVFGGSFLAIFVEGMGGWKRIFLPLTFPKFK
jgi:uncharacterized membrane protein